MTVREAQKWGECELRRHRCRLTDPRRETDELLAFVLDVDRGFLLIKPDWPLSAAMWRRFVAAVRRRLNHEPIERIIGHAQFRRLTLRVSPATLLPRPATEQLVETVLPYYRMTDALVVDVGTGSGAIALAVADEAPQAQVIATDYSDAALRVARRNARELKLTDRIRFRTGDLLTPALPALRRHRGPIVIIANLPYVPTGMKRRLTPEVRDHEPATALFSGPDGLQHYRQLLRQLKELTRISTSDSELLTLALECLPPQCQRLTKLLRNDWPSGKFQPLINDNGIKIGLLAELIKTQK